MENQTTQKIDDAGNLSREQWLTHDEMIAALQTVYPGSQHGKDFIIGMMVCPKQGSQLTSAFIMKWNLPDPEPNMAALLALVAPHVQTAKTAVVARDARQKRNALLNDSDVLVMRALESGDTAAQESAKSYRQALRDVSKQSGFPHTVDWPTAPQV